MRSAALSALLTVAGFGSAQSYVRGITTGHDITTHSSDQPIGGSFSGYYGDGANSVASSWFQASFMSAKLFAGVNQVYGVEGGAGASVDMEDVFTVHGGTGAGLMFVNLRVHGDVGAASYADVERGGYATASVSFDMHTSPVDGYPGGYLDGDSFNWYKNASSGPTGSGHQEFALHSYYAQPDPTKFTTDVLDPDGSFYRIPIHFRYDTPWDLSLSMWVQAGARNAGLATANFGNTFQWLGVDSFYQVGSDGSLVPVANASITSLSGANYAQPVPEPATMAALGLGVVSLLRRRRARRVLG